MAATKERSDAASELGRDAGTKSDAPACGLIMPISATANHDEKHWAAVQTLLHRGIKLAGFVPSNVWEGVNDRISKRIVSNIFRQDIVVADISDLNPNVMLELGLRLASKKPTVIVFEKGGKIPFDIADVGAIPYPRDLNILDMETFFEEFSELLKARYTAFNEGNYEPYLGDVVVEVLEPQTKEISIGEAVLERIDEMAMRMSRLEKISNSPRAWVQRDRPSISNPVPVQISIRVPPSGTAEIEAAIDEVAMSYSMKSRGDENLYEVNLRPTIGMASVDAIQKAARSVGGTITDISYN